jgi:hypothetical protein
VIKTKRHWVALATIVVIAWLGVREYRCKLRGTAFAQQVESIKRDAAKDLRVGTNKTEVARFFSEHNIPFKMLDSQAFGALRMEGCSPFGCGTNTAVIGVRLEVDGAGTVTETPRVFGMYQDCL